MNLPALIMVGMLGYDPRLWEPFTFYSAYTTLTLLVLVLALNPLQSLVPTSIFIKKVNRYRRQIGVAVFLYAFVHVLCFYIKRGSFTEFMQYMLHPAIIPGLFAFIILIVLAITSNNMSVKKLGSLRWKKLHKFVYVAEWLVVIHMLLMFDYLWAAVFFIPLMTLQYMRRRKRKKRKVKKNQQSLDS
jgi:sulfoxide reductase heme-binding subunit YedZ